MTKYKLQDLLDKCDNSIPMSEEEKEWEKVKPIGKEYGSDDKRKDQSEIKIND